jgi:GTP-binding protein HflX
MGVFLIAHLADEVPQLLVMNKIDLLDPPVAPHIDWDETGRAKRVWVSARNGAGLDLLQQAVASHFKVRYHRLQVRLPHTAGRLRAQLYDLGQVLEETFDEQGCPLLTIHLTEAQYQRLCELDDIEILAQD